MVWGDCSKGGTGQILSRTSTSGRTLSGRRQGCCRTSPDLCGPLFPPRHRPLQYLKKLHTQERAVEEVKLAIKPYYQKKDITKDEYKDILRKAVHKVGPQGHRSARWGGAGGPADRQTGSGRQGRWVRSVWKVRRAQDFLKPSQASSAGIAGTSRDAGLDLGRSGAHPSPRPRSVVWVQGLRRAGGDRSRASPPRSATAKVGRSTR